MMNLKMMYRFGKGELLYYIKYLIRKLILGQRVPYLAEVYFNFDCNLNCGYCFLHDRGDKTIRMPEQKIFQTIDYVKGLGFKNLVITGGEPLLLKETLLKSIEYAVKRGIYVYVATNGKLLNQEYLKLLIKAGVGTIGWSVDVISCHDGMAKNFENTIFEILLNARNKGKIVLNSNICLTRKNIDDAKKLIALFSAQGVLSNLHIAQTFRDPFVKIKTNALTGELFWPNPMAPEDQNRFIDTANWLIKNKKDGLLILNPLSFFEEMKNYANGNKVNWHCMAGRDNITINHTGKLLPCSYLNEAVNFGKIGDNFPFDNDAIDKVLEKCNHRCLAGGQFCYSHHDKHRLAFYWYMAAKMK